MISFNDITLQASQQTLLENANLRVEPGDKVVIRGASGCGKSSLLKAVVGAFPIAAGTVAVDDLELSAANVGAIRARLAFIGQEPTLGADSVREALLLPFQFKAHKNNPPSEDRISATLERLKLPRNILTQPAKRISGGEKQRVALARALLLDKTIFLADEVTSALDPESRDAVMDELFAEEITLLSVSHDAAWVGRCDRTIEILDRNLTEESR